MAQSSKPVRSWSVSSLGVNLVSGRGTDGQVRILITQTQIDSDSDQNSSNMACAADIDSHPDCRVRHFKGEDSADPSRQTHTQTQRQRQDSTHLVLSFPLSLFSLFLSLSF